MMAFFEHAQAAKAADVVAAASAADGYPVAPAPTNGRCCQRGIQEVLCLRLEPAVYCMRTVVNHNQML